MDTGKIISVIFGWFSVGAPVAIWIYLGQDAFLPPDLAETIFLTLIQVNATLIGFFGIMWVYSLRAYDENIKLYMTNAFKTTEKLQSLENDIEAYENMLKAFKLMKKQHDDWLITEEWFDVEKTW